MLSAIIQARMGSNRLPGKVMKDIEGKPLLFHVIKQTLSSKLIDNVVVATSISSNDNTIVKYCKDNKINYYRGSVDDVLDRFYKCAKKFRCRPVIRISADSPLIDPNVIDLVLNKFLNNSFDYLSNNIEKTKHGWKDSTCNFPVGTVIEVATFKALELAWKKAKHPSEREHVFPYVQSHSEIFNISNVKSRKNLSNIRITVDEKNDLKFVKEIYKRISKKKKFVTIKDIEKILSNEPVLLKINDNIEFDGSYKKSLLMGEK